MNDALDRISAWIEAGEPVAVIAGGTLVAASFAIFNALRILLYVPQLITCMRDRGGCQAINLFSWSSWIAANASTALYFWMFLGDIWGVVINAGNTLMCAVTVGVTLFKRHGYRQLATASSAVVSSVNVPFTDGTLTAADANRQAGAVNQRRWSAPAGDRPNVIH